MACCRVRGVFIEKLYATCSRVSSIYLPLQPKTHKIFEFKGLIGKIFRNKDLTQNPSLSPQSRQKLAQDFGSGMTPVHRLNRAVAGLCPPGRGKAPSPHARYRGFVRLNEKGWGLTPHP